MKSGTDDHFDDPRIDTALADYELWQEDLGNGDIEEFIRAHSLSPEIAAQLKTHLALEDQFQAAFCDTPARSVDDSSVVESVPDSIDRYRLIRKLGQGGMGTVWLAEQQQPVKRQVALKVIRPGFDNVQFVKRFESERQSLALMDHPYIAKVLDAGTTEQSLPYLVMEYVPGIPISEYCQDHQLTLRQRLQLFIDLGSAVQHAHNKGIIHRDIKPSNVLVSEVDGHPTVKVIDFGLAKALEQAEIDASQLTQTWAAIGTPLWMSPEQAESHPQSGIADVDTRADVYSLGALLYQLLTGTTPIEASMASSVSQSELMRLVREYEPPRPSERLKIRNSPTPESAEHTTDHSTDHSTARIQTRSGPSYPEISLAKTLGGDLDWIVLKAIDKNRDRRYETVNQFIDDIHRFIKQEPVVARPPSKWYRASKYLRRHKTAAIGLAATILALLAGIIGTSIGMIQALNYAQRAGDYATLATAESDRAGKLGLAAARSATAANETTGDLAAQRGQWREALEMYDNAIELEENNDFGLQIKRIRALVFLGESKQAQLEADELLQQGDLGPLRGKVLLLAGEAIATEENDMQAGMDYFQQALDSTGITEADRYYLQAVRATRLETAIELAEQAIAVDMNYQNAHQLLALLLLLDGQPDSVRRRVQQLRWMSPDETNYILLEAFLLALEGKSELAIGNLKLLSKQFSAKQIQKTGRDIRKLGQYATDMQTIFDTYSHSSRNMADEDIAANKFKLVQAILRVSGLKTTGNIRSFTRLFSLPVVQPVGKALFSIPRKLLKAEFQSARDEIEPLLDQYRIYELFVLHGQLCYQIGDELEDRKEKRAELLRAEKSLHLAARLKPLFANLPPTALIDALDVQQKLVFWDKDIDERTKQELSARVAVNSNAFLRILQNPDHDWHQWAMERAWMVIVAAAVAKDQDAIRAIARIWRDKSPGTYDHELMSRVFLPFDLLQAIEEADAALEKNPNQERARQTRDQAIKQLKEILENLK